MNDLPRRTFTPPSTTRMEADWKMLCGKIGVRSAGSKAEARAAEFIARQLCDSGLQVVRETFPCLQLEAETASVEVQLGRRWLKCEARALVGGSSTAGPRPIAGEVAWLELPEGSHRLSPGCLRGKIAVVFGSLPTEGPEYARLVAARPEAVLLVDDRLPFEWSKGDALFPFFIRKYGTLPAASVSYRAAWTWRLKGARTARVSIVTHHRRSRSQNIVGTLPGRDPKAGSIVFSAHHDSQPGSVGADDNASGVVGVLELARVLARLPFRQRTLHFISFGCEEQLAVGSTVYVAKHQREMNQIGLVVNLDAIASPLGHNHLYHSGQRGLAQYLAGRFKAKGYDLSVEPVVSPYADNFSFSRHGVPAVWFYRSNVAGGGRWHHHSAFDSLENVCAEAVAALINALVPALMPQIRGAAFRFPRKPSKAFAAETARLAHSLYGL